MGGRAENSGGNGIQDTAMEEGGVEAGYENSTNNRGGGFAISIQFMQKVRAFSPASLLVSPSLL